MEEMDVEKNEYKPVDLLKLGATQIEQGAEGVNLNIDSKMT
jgi:hypothetical protein